MNIQILAKTDQEIKFIIDEINPKIANSLRRIMINEIPVLAIDKVDFYDNTSALYDEIVAHRLGLLPIKFSPKDFNLLSECKCKEKGCSNCQVRFTLDKHAPGIVYAKSLKSTDKDTIPLYPDMPIVELFGEQKIKIEAVAVLGVGKDHAKFQASRSSYRYFPEVKLIKKCENPEETIKSCPKNALTIDQNAKVSVDCDLCKECLTVSIPKDCLEISGDETKFIFSVESISGLTAEQIVLQSLEVLKEKLKEFKKQVKKLK